MYYLAAEKVPWASGFLRNPRIPVLSPGRIGVTVWKSDWIGRLESRENRNRLLGRSTRGTPRKPFRW